jgi:hypothetical protein
MQMTPTPEQFRRLAEAMASEVAKRQGFCPTARELEDEINNCVDVLGHAWPIAFPVDPNAVTVRIAVGILKDRTHGFVVQACGIDDIDTEEAAAFEAFGDGDTHRAWITASIPPVTIPEVPASVEGA